MITTTTNIDEFIRDLTAMQRQISPKSLGKVVRGTVINLFKDIVKETPQWSGAATKAWTIVLTGEAGPVISPSGRMASKVPEHSKGDPTAVETCYSRNRWVNGKDVEFLKGCSIVNSQPYIELLEEGAKLRDLNKPGRMVERAKMKNTAYVGRVGWVVESLGNVKL